MNQQKQNQLERTQNKNNTETKTERNEKTERTVLVERQKNKKENKIIQITLKERQNDRISLEGKRKNNEKAKERLSGNKKRKTGESEKNENGNMATSKQNTLMKHNDFVMFLYS